MFTTLKNAWHIAELRKKICYTLLILILFRVGSAVPVPFLDSTALQAMVTGSGNLLGYIDILSGGAFSRATVFALSITPYITSSIVIQLLTVAIPALERLSKEGEDGRKKINKITRYVTVALALLQAFAYYTLLRNQSRAVLYRSGFAGIFSALVIIAAFTAGAMLVVYLGERIDENGVGNGISLILFAGIVSRAPNAINTLWSYLKLAAEGETMYYFTVPLIVVLFLALIVVIIIMTNAERRIPVQYAKRVVGRKMYGGSSTYLPLKINMSGVIPPIFASSILAIPTLISQFGNAEAGWVQWINTNLANTTSVWYICLYALMIVFFTFFYTEITFNTDETADNMKQYGGFIPGIRAGNATARYLKYVINRLNTVGAVYLLFVALLPTVLIMALNLNANLPFGGTTILIIAGVGLDTLRQAKAQTEQYQYAGFLFDNTSHIEGK